MIEIMRGKRDIIEYLSDKIISGICRENELEEISYLKMKLGLEAILINITKGIIVYGISILLDVFIPTLILHSAYFSVRRVSFGLHAKSSRDCTLISIIFFVIIPILVKDIALPNYLILAAFLLYTYCFYLYAPADTEKHPIVEEARRKALRKQSVATSLCLMIVTFLVSNSTIKILVTVGVALQVVQILPITYKLLRREYANYGKYEARCSESN